MEIPAAPVPTKSSLWKELVSYAFLAFVIVVPVRLWIAQPFVVNGSSMDTTFKDGEYLIVDELTYRFRTQERGEVLHQTLGRIARRNRDREKRLGHHCE